VVEGSVQSLSLCSFVADKEQAQLRVRSTQLFCGAWRGGACKVQCCIESQACRVPGAVTEVGQVGQEKQLWPLGQCV
jgi:hypothetical protein